MVCEEFMKKDDESKEGPEASKENGEYRLEKR